MKVQALKTNQKKIAVIVKVVNRVCTGGFTTDYQLRELPPEHRNKNNGKYICGNIESVEKAIQKANELNLSLYPNIVDLYWGAHEEPIKTK